MDPVRQNNQDECGRGAEKSSSRKKNRKNSNKKVYPFIVFLFLFFFKQNYKKKVLKLHAGFILSLTKKTDLGSLKYEPRKILEFWVFFRLRANPVHDWKKNALFNARLKKT